MKATTTEKKTSLVMLDDVVEGLRKSQKTLPSKYFYDKKGSEIFENICDLEEYYLTRTELKVMRENIHEITQKLGSHVQLIELGSGSSLKTRLLLNNLDNIASYVPVDISEEFLEEVAENLQAEYPDLNIKPVSADYTKPFDLPETQPGVKKIVYFPGSTIGNFTKEKASRFIASIADLVGENGGLLIGFDLVKDQETLTAAYDDSKGITAAFNKNILAHINRELNADFDLEQFEHRAVFNEAASRIEMHLVSKIQQQINIGGGTIYFSEGETIHTENSHKYSLASFRNMTVPYFEKVISWTDEKQLFAIQFLE